MHPGSIFAGRIFLFVRLLTHSLRILSQKEKAVIALLSLARVVVNFLDLAGIALVALVGSLALGTLTVLPVVGTVAGSPQDLLVLLLVSAGVVFAFKTLVGVALTRATMIYIAKIETQYSMRIAKKVFSGSLSELEKYSLAEIKWTVLRSSERAFLGILGSATTLLADGSLLLLIFAYMAFTDWGLALAVTIYLALILGGFQLFSSRIEQRNSVDFSEGSVGVDESFADLTSSFREIRVGGKTPYFFSVLAQRREKVARAFAAHLYLSAIPRLILELGLIAGIILAVVFQLQVGEGPLDLVTLGIFLTGGLRMMSALLPLQRSIQKIRFDGPAAKAAQDFLLNLSYGDDGKFAEETGKLEDEEEVGPKHRANLGLDVVFSGVGFGYEQGPSRVSGVKDISLSVESGRFAAIVGPSGSGKSTVLDLLLGLQEPNEGTIRVGGMSPSAFRDAGIFEVGFVPQHPGLVSGTIAENIALGVPESEIDSGRVWDAVRAASLESFVLSLPAGIKSPIGKQLDSMSGGQLQRMGLARALYTSPRLLVLDEVTSGLDSVTEQRISEDLERLRGTCTRIVVAHRISTIRKADVIYVLDHGQIVASGSFEELQKTNALFRKFLRLSSSG